MGHTLFFLRDSSIGRVSCLVFQVSPPARKWTDSRMYSGPVLQAEVQPAAKIPPPTLSTGGTGAEAHLPAPGGEERFNYVFKCDVITEFSLRCIHN